MIQCPGCGFENPEPAMNCPYCGNDLQAAMEPKEEKEIPKESFSSLDELGQLQAVRDMGVITEEEFQQMKRQLLGL